MGIAIHESLVARGFHVVNVVPKRGFGSWERSEYEYWCEQCLQGEFMLRIHNSGYRLAGYFQLESDAMLFTLRWS